MPSRASRAARWTLLAAGLAAVVAVVAAGAWILGGGPGRLLERAVPDVALTETEVQDRVYAALQREASASFLATGRLDVTATTRVESAKRLLPGLLDLDLGTTTATVRVPGRIWYGVDLSDLEARDIRLTGDTVHLRLPAPTVQAVEPALSEMEVRTDVGWARLPSRSGRQVERRAVALVEEVLREQGRAHLADSRQPRINTALAAARILAPALEAAGADPTALLVTSGGTTVRVTGG